MSEKSSSKKATKSQKPARKTTTKKTATRKTAARKAAAKKAAARKATAKKKSTAKKTSPKKASAKKASAKKVSVKKATRKKAGKIRASEMMKRASHTPAIFKTSTRRSGHIVFTLEDVRELLKERAKEESSAARKKRAKKTTVKKAVSSPKQDEAAAERAAEIPSHHAAASLDDILGLSPTSSVPNAKGSRTVPKKFRKYYSLLIQLRDQVRQELNLHSSETLKRSQKEDAGDISISVDAGTDNFDRDFALSLLSSEQEALNEIEAAIERIYDDSYGICQVTGKAISPERLEAVPFTRFSLEGQRQHESTAHRRVDRQGTFLNDDSGEAIGFGDEDGNN
ncbi:MAG: hypothetical protein GVY10_09025 [Verrucomicrobia bacterium]|jgi:RNA polymerase-binding transcription factor DksA|nr:hypothetical protein [Verrucomicrobiota bacterium]